VKQTLQLKLSQHLTLTPQLQQSIRLLQPLAAQCLRCAAFGEHQAQVVAHGELAEDAGFLGQIADAEPRPAVHRQPRRTPPAIAP